MKRIIGYISLIIIFITLGIIGFLNTTPDLLNENIINTNLYRFDVANGAYDELRLTENKISYIGTELDLDNCKTYKYNEKTNIITLDCDKSLKVISQTNDILTLDINNTNYTFFKEKEESYENAFDKTFNTTLDDYKIEGETLLEPYQINYEILLEKFDNTDNSYIYLISNSCENNCILFNKEFLNITDNPNKFVLNIDNINDEQYNNLVTLYEGLKTNKNEYKIPTILTIGNKKVNNILEIEIEGFNISKYNKYFDNPKENIGE